VAPLSRWFVPPEVETITTKRGKPVAPSAIDGMVYQADHLNYHALRAPEEPADGTIGVPLFLEIVSTHGREKRRQQGFEEAEHRAGEGPGPRRNRQRFRPSQGVGDDKWRGRSILAILWPE